MRGYAYIWLYYFVFTNKTDKSRSKNRREEFKLIKIGMKTFFSLFILFVFLFSGCYRANDSLDIPEHSDSLKIILPLYSFPTDQNGQIWNRVASAGDIVPIIVIWGILDTADAPIYHNYLSILAESKLITLVSYVATSDAQRPVTQVKQEINYYASNFNISGIFFDEVNNENKALDYYRQIIDYARSFPNIKMIILNSSYAPPEFIANTRADMVVIFENFGADWKDFDKESYTNIPAENKAVIVSNVWTKRAMRQMIGDMVKYKIGNVYITDKPYDSLPSYWDEEVRLVYEVNKKVELP